MAPRRDPARRRGALRWGMLAEVIAAALLLAKGYRILARRYAGGGGEIDLVAQRGRAIAFVEVKARADWMTAAGAIDGMKQRRFLRAVRHWQTRHPWSTVHHLRCDAVLVVPWRWPRHVPDAFPMDR